MKNKKLIIILVVALSIWGLYALLKKPKNIARLPETHTAAPEHNVPVAAASQTTNNNPAQPATVNKPKDLEEQIASYTAAIKANSTDKVALLGRAVLYTQKGYYAEAVNDYSTIIMQDNKNIKAYFYRAINQALRGNNPQAINDYKIVIALDPKNYLAYNNRGLLYIDTQNFERATEDFDNALKIDPNYAPTYYNYALLVAAEKNFAQAQQYLTKALELYDKKDKALEIKIRYRLAMAVYNQNNYQEALQQLNLAINLAPKDPKLYTLRALVYDQLNEKQKAFDDRAKVQELNLNSML